MAWDQLDWILYIRIYWMKFCIIDVATPALSNILYSYGEIQLGQIVLIAWDVLAPPSLGDQSNSGTPARI